MSSYSVDAIIEPCIQDTNEVEDVDEVHIVGQGYITTNQKDGVSH